RWLEPVDSGSAWIREKASRNFARRRRGETPNGVDLQIHALLSRSWPKALGQRAALATSDRSLQEAVRRSDAAAACVFAAERDKGAWPEPARGASPRIPAQSTNCRVWRPA